MHTPKIKSRIISHATTLNVSRERMGECARTRKLCAALRNSGCVVFAAVASAYQEPGVPDRYIGIPRVTPCWVEFKEEDAPLRPDQRLLIDRWLKAGIPVAVGRWRGDELHLHSAARHGCLLGKAVIPKDPVSCRRVMSELLSLIEPNA